MSAREYPDPARDRFERAFAAYVRYDTLRPMPREVLDELLAAKRALGNFPSGQQPVSAFVARPVNSPVDGGDSLLSDRENPRWRSATGSMPVHRVRQVPSECGDDGRMGTPCNP